MDNKGKMFDLTLFSNDKESLLISLVTHLKEGQKTAYIFTPNPEQVVQASKNAAFKESLQQADILIPDGIGLVWASRLLSLRGRGDRLTERIPGVEVAEFLLDLAKTAGYRVLLVGGRDYDLARLPQENFVWTPGYEDVNQPTREEESAVRNILEEFKPQIMLVAFGAPAQETWVMEHKAFLEKYQVKLVMVVGGTFDFMSGKIARAPGLVRAVGMEWLYRLVRQPWRAKRQTRLAVFIKMTLSELLK